MEQTDCQSPKDNKPSTDASNSTAPFSIVPSPEERFRDEPVKCIIRDVVGVLLNGKTYDEAQAKKWSVAIAKEVNERVKLLNMSRYKHIVHVVLGELKGAEVKSVMKHIWDLKTDDFTSEIFTNENIFCVTTVFAIFMY